jgi:DNA-binding NarL/FixJ family response regulator
MPEKIRVALVEDDRGTRESLVGLLRHAANLACLGAYESTEEAERQIPQILPDVVLMDINLNGESGIACVARLKRAYPQLKFLMLTTYDDSELIFRSLRAGASGYLLKRSAATELLAAIEEGSRGGAPMSMQIARKIVAHFHRHASGNEAAQLTSCESEILALLTKGLTGPRIAVRLGISHGAVRSHLHAIYGKLHLLSCGESEDCCAEFDRPAPASDAGAPATPLQQPKNRTERSIS